MGPEMEQEGRKISQIDVTIENQVGKSQSVRSTPPTIAGLQSVERRH